MRLGTALLISFFVSVLLWRVDPNKTALATAEASQFQHPPRTVLTPPKRVTPIRVAMDQVPATLNPRATLDAAGQRINALLFRALTQIDADLKPQADLAKDWKVSADGRFWNFSLKLNVVDHSGAAITPQLILVCLENYRGGQPTSPIRANIPNWKATRLDAKNGSATLTIELSQPDPYLDRNISSLRFFRVAGKPACTEPEAGDEIITSGAFRPDHWNSRPEKQLMLLAQEPGALSLELIFVRDESTRLLKFLRGEIDVIQNGLSPTKSRWLVQNHGDRFRMIERDGVNVAYLSFNMKFPELSRLEVRQAIALAIPRAEIVEHKLLGFGKVAGSLLSPLLAESHASGFDYDPAKAEALLEKAGFVRDKEGVRLRLTYKTTPVREGLEQALIIQEALKKIGIAIRLDIVEPAVFLASVRKGAYQLYSSRWIGVADASILTSTLKTGARNNRAQVSDPELDRLLQMAESEPVLERRLPHLIRVQERMTETLPYFPLWYWNNAVIMRKEFEGLTSNDLSLSGGLKPLAKIYRKSP